MKNGAWHKKRVLLRQRESICQERPADFWDQLRSIDQAIAAEEERHRLAVQNFKASRKAWKSQSRQTAH